MGHPWKTMAAFGAGALATLLLDPARGRRRRAEVANRAGAVGRRMARRGDARVRYMGGRLEGVGARARGAGGYRPESEADLREHLRQVIADLDVPTTDVNVDVAGGTATLRGEVQRPEWKEAVELAVAETPGVEGVESYLHLPGTEAPNKAAALRAS